MRLRRLSRAVLSVPGLVALLLLLGALAAGALGMVNSWSEQRALAQAIDSARVISILAVRHNLEPDPRTGLRTPNLLQAYDVQQEVNLLHADHRIVGLEVWRVDGTPLFTDAGHSSTEPALPEADRGRARAGRTWVARSGGGARGVASIDVFVPYLDAHGRGAAIAKVLLPDQQRSGAIRDANRLVRGCLLVLLLGVLAVVLVLRARLRAREHQARHDVLTGLLNRVALLEDSRSVLDEPAPGRCTALVVIDLDGFKTINDTLGHAAGDALLVQVASTLRAAVRPGDLVARLGGDEFAVVLRNLPATQDQTRVAQHVMHRLRAARFAVQGVALAVDASAGVAVHPEHGTTVLELLQRADVAMYQAKRAHLGTVLYDPATDHHDVGQLAVLLELREALIEDQLVLHYQPQVALATGEVTGVEALVRWQHPTRGLIFPDAFIPLAEPTGLLQPLTAWVLRTAIDQAVSWRRAGTELRVAVNISPRSLLEDDLPTTVLALLADAGLPAHLLELEVTETGVMSDPDQAADVLRRLGTMGVRVSIDDFGTGYSSLAHLRVLPVRTLKIDRSLVSHIVERPQDEAVTMAVVELGHRLGMEVLAEGVETQGAYERLRALSCDQAQGYLMSRPLPPAALEGWLAAWHAGNDLPRPHDPSRALEASGGPTTRSSS